MTNTPLCKVCGDYEGVTTLHGEPVCEFDTEWYSLYRRVVRYSQRVRLFVEVATFHSEVYC
jgi:hypothetical protein